MYRKKSKNVHLESRIFIHDFLFFYIFLQTESLIALGRPKHITILCPVFPEMIKKQFMEVIHLHQT